MVDANFLEIGIVATNYLWFLKFSKLSNCKIVKFKNVYKLNIIKYWI